MIVHYLSTWPPEVEVVQRMTTPVANLTPLLHGAVMDPVHSQMNLTATQIWSGQGPGAMIASSAIPG